MAWHVEHVVLSQSVDLRSAPQLAQGKCFVVIADGRVVGVAVRISWSCWIAELLEGGLRGARVLLGEVDGLVVVLVVVLCASGATVGDFGVWTATIGRPFGWGGVLVSAW